MTEIEKLEAGLEYCYDDEAVESIIRLQIQIMMHNMHNYKLC